MLLAVAIAAFAQIQQANLTGVVNDQSGAVVPGAAVVLENRKTKVKAKTETNAAGVYRLAVVPNPVDVPRRAGNSFDRTREVAIGTETGTGRVVVVLVAEPKFPGTARRTAKDSPCLLLPAPFIRPIIVLAHR